MNILAIAGSNSSTSINRQLAAYAASLYGSDATEVSSMRDYEMPLFGVDIEKQVGEHPLAQHFLDRIAWCDVLILSLPENNGAYSSAFKNVFDWASRIEKEVFQNKPALLMATSPGKRGGSSVLELAERNLVRYGLNPIATFSLPSFYENFDTGKSCIKTDSYDTELRQKIKQVENAAKQGEAQ